MQAIVLYESRYGNTERIARAVVAGLAAAGTARLCSVAAGAALDLGGIDLIVVGGPTEAHGVTPALRVALGRLSAGALRGPRVATFDTRFRWPLFLSGSAARSIVAILERQGAHLIMRPESFFVTRSSPPVLQPGESERAGAWAQQLVAAMAADTAARG